MNRKSLVFLPRPPGDKFAAELGELLANYGLRLHCAPLTCTKVLPIPPQLAVLERGGFSALTVSSPQTIKLCPQLPKIIDTARSIAPLTVFTTGEATAISLTQAGIRVDLYPPVGSAANLLTALTDSQWKQGDGKKALLLGSAIASKTLFNGLTKFGWNCENAPIYTTVNCAYPDLETTRLWSENQFAAAIVTASSNARALADFFAPTSVGVVAIGAPSAEAAKNNGLNLVSCATTPTAGALANAVLTYLGYDV